MNASFIDKRLEICSNCPIYNSKKSICDPDLWINPKTDKTSTIPRAGFIRGCGCFIKVKVKNFHNHCIAGKW